MTTGYLAVDLVLLVASAFIVLSIAFAVSEIMDGDS